MFFGVPGWTSHQPSIQRIEASYSEQAKEKLKLGIGIFVDSALKMYNDENLMKEIRESFENREFIRVESKHDFKPYKKI